MKKIFGFLKKYGLLFLGAVAMFFVVSIIGDTILFPSKTLDLVSPTAVVSHEKGMVLVDNHHQRLIFTNKDKEVIYVTELGNKDAPFDMFYDIFLMYF